MAVVKLRPPIAHEWKKIGAEKLIESTRASMPPWPSIVAIRQWVEQAAYDPMAPRYAEGRGRAARLPGTFSAIRHRAGQAAAVGLRV